MPPRRRHLLSFAILAASRPARASRARVGEVSAVAGTAAALFPGDPPRSLVPASPVLLEDLLATEASARLACRCGSAWNRDPCRGVIGVEEGPHP